MRQFMNRLFRRPPALLSCVLVVLIAQFYYSPSAHAQLIMQGEYISDLGSVLKIKDKMLTSQAVGITNLYTIDPYDL